MPIQLIENGDEENEVDVSPHVPILIIHEIYLFIVRHHPYQSLLLLLLSSGGQERPHRASLHARGRESAQA